jgi:DNA-binding CsgD family transcriptional regulator/sugar-specific transcriptional regulator TrmB
MQTPDRAEARLLIRFGISAEAERVWRLLLLCPNLEQSDIEERVGLNERALEAAVDALRHDGFLRSSPTPTGVAAVDPTIAVGHHASRAEREATEVLEAIALLRTCLPDLTDDYDHGRRVAGDLPGFEIVVPIPEIRDLVQAAGENIQYEQRSMLYLVSAAGIASGFEADARSIGRGVTQRSLVRETELASPEVFAAIETSHSYGEEIRTHPEVPTQMIIFDRSLAVVRVDPIDPTQGAMFIRVRNLIDLLTVLFDRLWADSRSLFLPPVDCAPTGRAAHVLALLANGTKDETIARTLGVGARTIRRDVTNIKSALGVASRAEILTAAMRRGWI